MPDTPNDQPDDSVMAGLFRAVLTLAVATPADLVPWADEQIRVRDRPPEWIIDVALSASLTPGQALANLPERMDRDYPPGVFGYIVGFVDGTADWAYPQARAAAAWLLLAARCSAPDDALQAIDSIDDSFSLCDQGIYGDPQALVADAVDFVDRHADVTARQRLPSVRVTFD